MKRQQSAAFGEMLLDRLSIAATLLRAAGLLVCGSIVVAAGSRVTTGE